MHEETKTPRPPVVVVMGHIDHGKSTLLDYIRKTTVTDNEAGGITQHISAYEAEYNKRKIVFLDTPGHEAFHGVRKSGSKVADIAVIVVSTEDGVKPQTIETVEEVKNNKIPFIIAINKIDKPNANSLDGHHQGDSNSTFKISRRGYFLDFIGLKASFTIF